MSLSSKNTKNIKIQNQIRSKRIQWNTYIMRFQTIDRQFKFRSNLKWIKYQDVTKVHLPSMYCAL